MIIPMYKGIIKTECIAYFSAKEYLIIKDECNETREGQFTVCY